MCQKNRVAGYRTMLGKTQLEMSEILNISRQAYSMKENGKISFKDNEKQKIKELLLSIFPTITIDEIFLQKSFKMYQKKVSK
ncbi:helix-turn-helix transcriptional regulator [Enterococcus casseliflavus]|uniref:helix-turn-helix transcriptional regulator n=1 Tax=Enterococcus casseliflavus TaxID=37734 RepID=UPI0039A49619